MIPTKEMMDRFYIRTTKHIELVQKYIDIIVLSDSERYKPLIPFREVHDLSKYQEPELTPYIFLTWKYYCLDNEREFKSFKGLDKDIQEATFHHVKNNSHHPEYHDLDSTLQSINPKDRDKPPDKMVDGTEMSYINVAEMVADWMAMAEEKGTDPKEWAKMNVNKRWKFKDYQVSHIYELLKLY